jgi:hypothetical protein
MWLQMNRIQHCLVYADHYSLREHHEEYDNICWSYTWKWTQQKRKYVYSKKEKQKKNELNIIFTKKFIYDQILGTRATIPSRIESISICQLKTLILKYHITYCIMCVSGFRLSS